MLQKMLLRYLNLNLPHFHFQLITNVFVFFLRLKICFSLFYVSYLTIKYCWNSFFLEYQEQSHLLTSALEIENNIVLIQFIIDSHGSKPKRITSLKRLFFSINFQVANNPCTNLLLAHYRLSGHPHVNPLHQVIQGASQTYLFFKPSQVRI